MLLVLRRAELTAANFGRPLFRERRLRVVLLASDDAVAAAYQHAPDLMDWISDIVEAPSLVPGFVRDAMGLLSQHFPGLRWLGDLDEARRAVSDTSPRSPCRVTPAPTDYGALVEALDDPRGWRLVPIETEADALRLRMALAESRRRGRVIAVGAHVPGWPTLDPTLATWAALDASRPPVPGEIAARLDCEAAAIAHHGDLIEPTAEGFAGQGDLPTLRVTICSADRVALMRAQAARARAALAAGDTRRIADVAAWAERTRTPPDLDRLPPRLAAAAMVAHLRLRTRPAALANYALAMGWVDLAKRWSETWPPVAPAQRLGLLDEEPGEAALATGEHAAARPLDAVLRDVRALGRAGRFAEADALLEPLTRAYRAIASPASPDVIRLMRARVDLLDARGSYAAAETLLRECLSILAAHPEVDRGVGGTLLSDLGTILARQGRADEAETVLRRALSEKASALGPDHPSHAGTEIQLAEILSAAGRHGEAERRHRSAVATLERSYGRRHPDFAFGLQQLAITLARQGRYPEAEALLREALDVTAAHQATRPLDYAHAQHTLGTVLGAQGRAGEAAPLFRAALATRAATLGASHPDHAASLLALAQAVATDEPSKGARLSALAAESLDATLGSEHPLARQGHQAAETLEAMRRIAPLYDDAAARLHAGDAAGAAEALGRALRKVSDPTLRVALLLVRAKSPVRAGQRAKALETLDRALEATSHLAVPRVAVAEIDALRRSIDR